jgi:predicted DsbA family dithiol-disulfide isomerase
MHDSLFATQGALSDTALVDRAQVLGLDTKRFNECLSSGRYADELRKALEEAEKMGIDGTPIFFIGAVDASGESMTVATRIAGAHPYEIFRSALDEILALQNQQSVQTH